ncbi:Protein-tyrosine phosphatase [Teladorsagia circumcincta]|uniref:Protein-tyrosine phosphatase n=1 Tax=Teladorsagia circumcincta TaxID=45464 RepID=A0A2G9V2L5_TELCI|nr:Protein-tyrosine phosphatase [Teladorsagia circumcincta]
MHTQRHQLVRLLHYLTAQKQPKKGKDVVCTDTSRVVLTWPNPAAGDYIHANWITEPDVAKKFICTQAPTDNTVEDFWRMIWQEKCKSIIMLCNLTECGKKKCEQYWPDSSNPSVTLESVVRSIRNDRHGSVQTDVQYLFMHRILLAVAENKRVITTSDVEKFITDYDAFCKSKGYI